MIKLIDVLAAQQVIDPHVWRTPLIPSVALGTLVAASIHLKLECWQKTGSFKVRGALNRLAALTPEQSARGVVTASAGNHGLGVAYASQVLGLPPATIFVPENAPAAKRDHLAVFDCRLIVAGADYDQTHATAKAHAQEQGALYVSAYDDPLVIAGQATVGLETMEELPNTDILLVPIGGGGLVAGVALAAKAINPDIRVLGIQPEASPAAYLSLRNHRPYETYPAGPTICDGLAGGFGSVPFEMAAELIDQVVVVPESSVRWAVAWLLVHEQLVVEGAGAISIAPLLNGQLDITGQKAVALLTGRNLDAATLQGILLEELAKPKV